jgi:hypothetical protein
VWKRYNQREREREGRRYERLKESELEGELQRRRDITEKRERLESEREL